MERLIKEFGRAGVIGRFKPLHKGGALMLEAICEKSENVIIGIGSSNKYNVRSPFTAQESREMIESFLSKKFSNYSIVLIPDFGHLPEYSDGQKWREYVVSVFGNLDCFVSGNEYVSKLLEKDYKIIHPASLIPKELRTMVCGSLARAKMALGSLDWKELVPDEVSQYLEKNNLIERFRREFGLETLANLMNTNYLYPEDYVNEKNHIMEM